MALKIQPDHLSILTSKIQALDTEYWRNMYRTGQFARSELVKDLDKRYRNDLLRAAVPSRWICDTLYPYLNDAHIDSALRTIVPSL